MTSKRFMAAIVAGALAAACAARPVPAVRVGSAEAAVREARQNGAERVPAASLHLRLANEQLEQARRLIAEGEHDRAQWLLVRAEADAEVAAALAREAQAKALTDEADVRARQAANATAPGGHVE